MSSHTKSFQLMLNICSGVARLGQMEKAAGVPFLGYDTDAVIQAGQGTINPWDNLQAAGAIRSEALGGGAIGGLLGGLGGHVLTKDKEKKSRNAVLAGLLGALSGTAIGGIRAADSFIGRNHDRLKELSPRLAGRMPSGVVSSLLHALTSSPADDAAIESAIKQDMLHGGK